MLTKRRIIAAKIEAAEGVDITPSIASDGGILAFDPKIELDFRMIARNTGSAAMGRRFADAPGAKLAKITFNAEMKGMGAAYALGSDEPAIGKYLEACGFAKTVADDKATYNPISSDIPSLSIYCFEDGVVKKLVGCRGNVKISGKAGEQIIASFEFLGRWGGISDAALAMPTYETTVPPIFQSAAFSIANYSAIIANFSLDMANEIKYRSDVSSAEGVKSAIITGRNPNGTIDPEMTLVATHDWIGKWASSGDEGALTVGSVGSVAGNKIKITAPKIAYTNVGDADREGLAVADLGFQLVETNGNDELAIEFS